MKFIEVEGASSHNLKDVSCRFPIGALSVVTGPSGSGKSSLAFDTLYAEGQRRFVESMSTYARQFLERMERPKVTEIRNILPAIAIQQGGAARSARSTVGTATEIDDVLRLLLAAIGRTQCFVCGLDVTRDSPGSAAAELFRDWGEGARVLVFVLRKPVVAEWLRAGFHRVLAKDGTVIELSPDVPLPKSALDKEGRVALLVGRHVLSAEDAELATTLTLAFDLGDGALSVRRHGTDDVKRFHRGLVCNGCSRAFLDPVPALFSFNSPRGACETCQGFGRIAGIDESRVIPDPGKSLRERPIAPFNSPAYESAYTEMEPALTKHRVRKSVPWADLSAEERDVVWNGRGAWYGVKGLFDWLEKKRYKVHVRVLLARYRGYTTCPSCNGARLRPEALAVRMHGETMATLATKTLEELRAFFGKLVLDPRDEARGGGLVADLVKRLDTLVAIGLPYLSLGRPLRTLSGGEAQRIQLGSAIGNSLTGTLYVLDEPTVGLHAEDTDRLLGVLERLAAQGNAVVAVEHDTAVIRRAAHVVDLGPHAGRRGGEVVFEGTPFDLEGRDTATGRALLAETAEAARQDLQGALVAENEVVFAAHRFAGKALTVVGARAHNLKDVTVRIPLGKLVAVAGVSGSGKSSLVVDVLAAGTLRALGKPLGTLADAVGEHTRIDGLGAISDLVLVDQSPLGRSARSNPATFTKAWDDLRALFARTPDARSLGLGPGSFSFNAVGGRCETCEGNGFVAIDMQFLSDVTVVCESCDGKRFGPAVLSVRLRGRNISDVLAMTIEEALSAFGDVKALVSKLSPLEAAGLSYLTLGQPTSTLSGGEAQRLKIASFLGGAKPGSGGGHTLFVFDEPTTGLSPEDVDVLLRVFRKLLSSGHSILAVEHHLGFLRKADHVIELGPSGGPAGGHIVFAGTPRELMTQRTSPTGRALRSAAGGRTSLQSADSWPKVSGATS